MSLQTKRFSNFVELFGRLSALNPNACHVGHKHVYLYRSKSKSRRGTRVQGKFTKRSGRYLFTEAFAKFRFWHVEFRGTRGCRPSRSKKEGIRGV